MIDANFVRAFAHLVPAQRAGVLFFKRLSGSSFADGIPASNARKLTPDYEDAFVKEVALEGEVATWSVFDLGEGLDPRLDDEIGEADGTRWRIRRRGTLGAGAWWSMLCVKVA